MSRLKAKRLFWAVFLLACILCLLVWYFVLPGHVGMNLPFRKVDRFEEGLSLMANFGTKDVIRMELGKPGGTWEEIAESNGLVSRFDNHSLPAIAACPDGSRYYITVGDLLGIFEDDLLKQIIPIEDFGFGDGEYFFGYIAFASQERLWFSAKRRGDLFGDCFLVEWSVEKKPGTRKIGPVSLDWHVDPDSRQVFVHGVKSGIYDFGAESFEEIKWDDSYFDYDKEHGLLISSAGADSTYQQIVLTDIDYGSKEDVTWGGQAQWGCDGYIYFLRGSTQLWRIKPGEERAEAVFLATKWVDEYKDYYGHALIMDAGRRYVAFAYNITNDKGNLYPLNYKSGLLLLDLVEQEYMEFKPEELSERYLEMYLQGIISLDDDHLSYLLMEKMSFAYFQNMAWVVERE